MNAPVKGRRDRLSGWTSPSPAVAKLAWIVGVGWLVLIAGLSLIPQQNLPDLNVNDKVQHLAGYLVLGVLSAIAARGWARRLQLLLGITAIGGLLEILQLVVPGRSSEVSDAVANGLGAILGVVGCGVMLAACGLLAGSGRA